MSNRPPSASVAGSALGLIAVAVLTAVLYGLQDRVEELSLLVCYQLIVLVVSGLAGALPGLITGVASVLTFNWFFLPPLHTLGIADAGNWAALAVFAITALVTAQLAAGSRQRRHEADARSRDATAIAALARSALADVGSESSRPGVERAAAEALGVVDCRLAVDPGAAQEARRRMLGRPPDGSDNAVPLVVEGRPIGLLRVGVPRADRDVRHGTGFPAAVAGIAALAMERGRLLGQVLEVEALRRSDALKTALLRSVSHEFRTPITAVRTAAEALAQKPSPADADDLVAVLTGEAERLERLVVNLLDLSRLEAGGLTARMDWCDPAELASGAVAAADALLDGHEVELVLSEELPLVRADAVLCERILVNLLHNAVRHGAPPVRLELRAERDEVRLTVEDRGPGPDPAVRPRLFSAFAAGRGTGGSGVGLALARGLASSQGGALRLEAGGPTRFTLALPREPVPEVA